MHIDRIKKYHCFFLIYFVFLTSLNSQNLFFEKITGRDIKPVTQIHGIVKDSVGYIWIGSWNGVYRYDGRTFDFYYHNPNDKTSLPNNRIRNIISDKTYGLWFLTFERKYVKFNYKLNSFSTVDSVKVPQTVVKKIGMTSNVLNEKELLTEENITYLSTNLPLKKSVQDVNTITPLISIIRDSFWTIILPISLLMIKT